MFARLLRPLVQFRDGEITTALLMFLYSFLAMAGYNMIKPVTRGLFIEKLGAENLPWVQFGAGIVIAAGLFTLWRERQLRWQRP